MDKKKWFGVLAHLVLGWLFPYVLVGGIVLVYGFMAPSTGAQKAYGLVILLVYALLIMGTNLWTLRSLDFRSKWRWGMIHTFIWAGAVLLSFAMLRFSS
ncbi:hypothetical protein [Paenibacillus glycanilyticus]|uniref:Uncharacterized protein n=1 Tax=Paenibacillus glycanilyticus TaxID=126569 RepID=A0ABQ6GAU9_9BACL|nr:hypothetical protein [Paenibacillus glycanilyticus]GLX68086.1 hypothetical protein MU1_24310 [Paenibacillus glycanilyticus]